MKKNMFDKQHMSNYFKYHYICYCLWVEIELKCLNVENLHNIMI